MNKRVEMLEVSDDQSFRIEEIRHKFSDIFNVIDDLCASNRETSLAITKLEEACFWAIKGISREVVSYEK